MNRNEISEKIRAWFDAGKLVTNGLVGGYYKAYKKLVTGEYIPTCIPTIIASDEATANEFNAMHENGIIVSYKELKEKHPELKARYDVDRACMYGRFTKVRIGGVVIFITLEEES